MKPDWLEDGEFITKVCVGVLGVCFLVFILIFASTHAPSRNRMIIVDMLLIEMLFRCFPGQWD